MSDDPGLDTPVTRGLQGARQRPQTRQRALLFSLTAVVVALNALKPLHIDDTYFYYQARHLAENPSRPLDVEIFWFQWPRLATESTVPLVGPYWLAAGIRLFGENPFLWKLWFSPFVLAFVSSVQALLARFAPRNRSGLTAMIVLSPVYLPSWNLMLDMPALALALTSLVLFMEGSERRGHPRVVASGLLAGLAMQTKYTGVLAPAGILLYAAVHARVRLGLLAAAAATALFGLWESALFLLHGRSPFLWSVQHSFPAAWANLLLAKGLLMTVGGTSVCAALLAMAGLGVPRSLIFLSAVLVPAGYAWIVFRPAQHAVFAAFGTAVALGTLAAIWRLFRPQAGPVANTPGDQTKRATLFLVLWLALEIAGYFVISPFCAVRRVLGVVLVGMLLTARLLSLAPRQAQRGAPAARTVMALGIVLGLAYGLLDLREARVARSAALDGASWIRERDPEPRIWYVGHWGFAYYADRAGMRPLVPDHSRVRAGDWLVAPTRIDRQNILYEAFRLNLLNVKRYGDRIKVGTVPYYYAGIVPLKHREGPRLELYLFRARTDFVPQTAWSPSRVAEWARQRKEWAWSLSALPYMVRALRHGGAPVRALMAEAIGELGAKAAGAIPFLEQALHDPNPEVRRAASQALHKMGRGEDDRSGNPFR